MLFSMTFSVPVSLLAVASTFLSSCTQDKAGVASLNQSQDGQERFENTAESSGDMAEKDDSSESTTAAPHWIATEKKDIAPSTPLDCLAHKVPMSKRFPNQILLDGVNSKEIYLKRDPLAWNFILVALGDLKKADTRCQVSEQGSEDGLRALTCSYSQFPMLKRTLTIPLVAEKGGYIFEGQSEPSVQSWRISGAKLEGPFLEGQTHLIELVCIPRTAEFGFEQLTQAEVNQMYPWQKK